VDLQRPVSEYLRRGPQPLRADATIAEALASLRGTLLPERIVYFYVGDEDGRLVGVVPTRRLLAAEPASRVAEVMAHDLVTLSEAATLADASEELLAHRLLALPVVDGAGRFVGTVDASLFFDGVVPGDRSAIDDVFQVIGVHVARARRRSAWEAFRERFPWLLANVAGGLACAALVGRYEAFLDAALVLALFMPVVLALAESVSIQSMTLTLQALHAGLPAGGRLLGDLARELATALLLGAACGALVASVVWAWRRDALAALVIGATILLAIATACLLGVLLPTAVRALRLDPKLAAGPITLALADVLALLFYFTLAARLLP
jgi:magnesium transporter